MIVHLWGLHVKGPVYVALFRPLSIAIAAVMGVIILGDALYLGRYLKIITICRTQSIYFFSFNILINYCLFVYLMFLLKKISIIGAIIISFGFYVVMWAKTQEEECEEVEDYNQLDSPPSRDRDPLLQG